VPLLKSVYKDRGIFSFVLNPLLIDIRCQGPGPVTVEVLRVGLVLAMVDVLHVGVNYPKFLLSQLYNQKVLEIVSGHFENILSLN
jgi:hypothetical protein